MTGTYPNLIAGGITTEGTFAPFELFGGESPITTSQTMAAANIPIFTPVALNSSGALVAFNPAGSGSVAVAIGIAAQPIVTGTVGPYYTGGNFNIAAIAWPGALTTDAAKKAVFAGSPITVTRLL